MNLYKESVLLLLLSLLLFVSSELRVHKSEEVPSCEDEEDGLGIHINLTKVEITKIRADFLTSSLVTCLTLKDNSILEIDEEAFRGLPNLHYLNLAGNKIPQNKFDYDWSTIKTLVLDFAIAACENNNGYRNEECYRNGWIPQPKYNNLRFPILSKLPSLEKLYLRNNGLQSLTWNRRMANLTHLYLDENRINLSDLIAFIPPTLTHLSLSRNLIQLFAHSPILLQLEELTLDGNNIRVLCYDYNCFEPNPQLPQDPEEPTKLPWEESDADRVKVGSYIDLRGATKLRKLSMASNELMVIRDGAFTDLKSLQYLDLSSNSFRYIQPEAFRSAENLTTLLLSNNTLKHVPNFAHLESLEMLMLDGNEITAVESAPFLNLTMLQILSLAKNSINQIDPMLLEALPLLYELDLSGNRLTTLPGNWMSPETALRRLHLDSNLFTNIENMALRNVTDLEYLNIAGNPFQLLSVKSLIQLPENTVINAEVVSFNGDRVRCSASGV
ncbi:toll-like receptor 13 [Diachasma alloeum]|uniref:toll-like receptor 13 n=1 Tax=Diachasma alloeum TaxID=454923 RepID=UPI0007382310|nr:toll-like receptor 13 [Diachasma alloeum]